MSEIGAYNHHKDDHYLVKVNKQLKCICQMCSCGKHRCPKQEIKGDFTTSYGSQYQNYKMVPITPHQTYKYNERHYNPEVLRSHYQQAYIPAKFEHTEEKTMSASRLGSIGREILKSEPFVSDTSYKDQYKPFKVQMQEEKLSSSQVTYSHERSPLKFQGESSYKSTFHQLPIPKIERFKHPQYKKSAPFQGNSSYKNDFPSFKVELSRQQQTNSSVPQKQVKFEGSSSYRNAYGTFKVVAPEISSSSCKLDQLNIPNTNYLNQSKHVYYDQEKHQFT